MDKLTNIQANSHLGIASRQLAFVLVEPTIDKDRQHRDITELQTALFHYGNAIADLIVDHMEA